MSNSIEINPNPVVSASKSELNNKQFIICDECYWCASALSRRMFNIDVCPECKKLLSSLAIENNEVAYRISVRQKVAAA